MLILMVEVQLRGFIKVKLMTGLEITRAPALLGGGVPLFGQFDVHVALENAELVAYLTDFTTTK